MPLLGLYIDPLYLVLFIVTLAISGGAQLYIRSTFSRWSQEQNSLGLPGADVGQRLVSGPAFARGSGAGAAIRFKIVPGDLSDHFDPRTREVGLSQEVASRPSVAAMAVTAHEVGHAQQHAEGTFAMKARSILVPAVTFSPLISYLFIFLGLILNITGLFWLGIIAFGLLVVFTILTLPVEIGASRRALVMLRDTGMLAGRDEEGVRKVLTAAALTYVAAAVTAVLTLLYYLSLAQRR